MNGGEEAVVGPLPDVSHTRPPPPTVRSKPGTGAAQRPPPSAPPVPEVSPADMKLYVEDIPALDKEYESAKVPELDSMSSSPRCTPCSSKIDWFAPLFPGSPHTVKDVCVTVLSACSSVNNSSSCACYINQYSLSNNVIYALMRAGGSHKSRRNF